jgi:hypothetical protein
MIDCDTQMPHIVNVGFAFDGYHHYIQLEGKRTNTLKEKRGWSHSTPIKMLHYS